MFLCNVCNGVNQLLSRLEKVQPAGYITAEVECTSLPSLGFLLKEMCPSTEEGPKPLWLLKSPDRLTVWRSLDNLNKGRIIPWDCILASLNSAVNRISPLNCREVMWPRILSNTQLLGSRPCFQLFPVTSFVTLGKFLNASTSSFVIGMAAISFYKILLIPWMDKAMYDMML